MDTKEILAKIKTLIREGSVNLEKFLEVQVGETLIQVDGDVFEVGQSVKVKTEDGFIPAGTSLDGEHIIDDIVITILDGVIVDVKENVTEDVATEPIETLSEVKLQSYDDYPQTVKDTAQKVLDYVAENGWGTCGTDVGKQRANQLAKGEPISEDTIQRMYSYLSRHKVDLESSKDYSDGCGKLMYDAWGGEAALSWSKTKLETLEMSVDETIQEDEMSLKLAELEDKIIDIETNFKQIKDTIDDYSKKMEDFFEKYNSDTTKFQKVFDNLPAKFEIENFKTETAINNNQKSNNTLETIRNIRSKN